MPFATVPRKFAALRDIRALGPEHTYVIVSSSAHAFAAAVLRSAE